MSVRLKLVVIIVFVALVPLAVSAFTALGIHRTAFDRETRARQQAAAHDAAALAQALLDGVSGGVAAVAAPIGWSELSEAELGGAASLVYRQHDAIAAVQILDEAGRGVGGAVFLVEPSADPAVAGHPALSAETIERVAAAIPASRGRGGVAVGEVFATAGDGRPMVDVAVAVDGGGAAWTLVAAVALDPLCERLRAAPAGSVEVLLLDAAGRAICGGEAIAPLSPAPAALARAGGGMVEYDSGGERMRGAVAPLPNGWRAVAQQSAASATAPGRRMRAQTWFWIAASVVVALVAGLLLAQGIIAPVRRLAGGAEALARGELSHRLDARGGDELGELAGAFNHMAKEIQARDGEIQAWNRELQERVDARTRELKDAQQQLLQSQKIAAVSSLAAGVAHEINNPLTGVIGLAQVLEAQQPEGSKQRELLATVGTEARRIGDIVKTLMSFSHEYTGEGMGLLDLGAIADGALEMVKGKLAQHEVTAVRDYAADTPRVRGHDAQLRRAVLHVLDNALAASRRGGTITVQTRSIDGKVAKLRVSDTGVGIAPENLARIFEPFFTTKRDWEGRGLGLTVAYRVIEEHRGAIKVDSVEGKGTTVEITLPSAAGKAHLV